MRTILVLTDFSIAAKHAADSSLVIARYLNASILLFNSYAVPVINFSEERPKDYTELKEDSTNGLKMEMERLRKISEDNFKDIHIEYQNSILPFSDCIYEIQSTKRILLTVTGKRRRSHNHPFIFGSHLHRTMAASASPVLICTTNTINLLNVKVNFASDFDKEDIRFVKCIAKHCHRLQGHLLLSHVSTPVILVPDFREDEIVSNFLSKVSALEYNNIRIEPLLSFDAVAEINLLNKEANVDLVALVYRKHNMIWPVFNRRKSHQFVKKQAFPLLIIPENYKGFAGY